MKVFSFFLCFFWVDDWLFVWLCLSWFGSASLLVVGFLWAVWLVVCSGGLLGRFAVGGLLGMSLVWFACFWGLFGFVSLLAVSGRFCFLLPLFLGYVRKLAVLFYYLLSCHVLAGASIFGYIPSTVGASFCHKNKQKYCGPKNPKRSIIGIGRLKRENQSKKTFFLYYMLVVLYYSP